MKRLWKQISLVGLILLYSCLVSFSTSYLPANNPSLVVDGHTSEKGSFNSAFAKDLLCHTSQNENFLQLVPKAPPSLLKSSSLYNTAIIKKAESFVQHKFLQYNLFSINILGRLQPADIVFPFHYFW
ncbi:MAG: hypothetical protein IPI78_11615 [Chitinophagaceae bacterium]|nr:hypothetical protein [Chitinophagaceae bacterium]